MKNRVKIGTCSGPAEAAFVRSVFDAHELPVVINGEMHAYAMGGLGGFVRLEIFVDRDDAEDAIALLNDIRAGDHAVSEGDELAPEAKHVSDERTEGARSDERADAAGVWNAEGEIGPAAVPPATRAFTPTTGFDMRRRRTGIVLLLSMMVGFGTAHMSTGAWVRGALIAVLQAAGLVYGPVTGNMRGAGWILIGLRFADMLGALWRVWSDPRYSASGGSGSSSEKIERP